MSAQRLEQGGEIDRSRVRRFRFDGQAFSGFAGDSVASALLAGGAQILGRSFKYHRPRGLLGAGWEEPNALLDLRHGSRHDPNARITREVLEDGMELHSVHASGSAAHDRLAFLDRFARFIPAAFYYKTFMWPHWRLFEGAIRRMAGIGRLDPHAQAHAESPLHLRADVCVIGAGPAGLAAAQAAQALGRRVVLADERSLPGGSLLWRETRIAGVPGAQWAAEAARSLVAGGATVLQHTSALGLYDHNAITLLQREAGRERLVLVRAREIVLATGAIERPLLFAHNDRPGVMLADAVLEYLRRYAVRAGERVVVATANDAAWETAFALQSAGARCIVVDARAAPPLAQAAQQAGIELRTGARVAEALGAPVVSGVRLDSGERIACDLVAVGGGWNPLINLWCHSRGRPRWHAELGCYLPGDAQPGLRVAGSANGAVALAQALAEGAQAGGQTASVRIDCSEFSSGASGAPDLSQAGSGRVWVDLQHDVTVKDLELAIRENFRTVEHLKRYTTLGMANDQGRTSNVNGLAVLADRTARSIADVGITTFRPPYVPVPMAAVAGHDRGELQHPLRRLPAENAHRAEGAHFRDYGNLLRPAWYGPEEGALARECRAARESVAVLDASSLGKIEVIGPDAAALVDFVFYHRLSTLAPGRLRYTLALSESGSVWDDGVVMRLAPEHFVVSCSSGHVAAMTAHLQEWREDHFDLSRVFVHDCTSQWATMAISGPQSRAVLEALALGVTLDDAAFPHMSLQVGRFHDRPARVARVSFTGERSYEVSVPAALAESLWQAARAAGAAPLGVEALGVLRAEKGFLFIGQDTDAETQPQDLGMDGPRRNRQDAYVGDRSLFLPESTRSGRRQLVGIASEGVMIPPGAHAVVAAAGGRRRSIGFVTSSYDSVLLGRPVALALIEDGLSRMGELLAFEHLGARHTGRVVGSCFLDPAGERLHV
jgi:sarcosine oxidase subunit alpha